MSILEMGRKIFQYLLDELRHVVDLVLED